MTTYVYTCPLCKVFIKAHSVEPINIHNKREYAYKLGEAQMAHIAEAHPENFRTMMDLSATLTLALFQKHYLTTDAQAAALRAELLDAAIKTFTGEWEHTGLAAPPAKM